MNSCDFAKICFILMRNKLFLKKSHLTVSKSRLRRNNFHFFFFKLFCPKSNYLFNLFQTHK